MPHLAVNHDRKRASKKLTKERKVLDTGAICLLLVYPQLPKTEDASQNYCKLKTLLNELNIKILKLIRSNNSWAGERVY